MPEGFSKGLNKPVMPMLNTLQQNKDIAYLVETSCPIATATRNCLKVDQHL